MKNVVKNAEIEVVCDHLGKYKIIYGFGAVYINFCEL